MRTLLVTIPVLLLILSFPLASAFGAETEEWTVSGESAYEFFLGMAPPVHRGDWAAFEMAEGKTRATVIETEGVGTERRLIIASEDQAGDGRVLDKDRRDEVLSQAVRDMVERHEYFVASPRKVTVKGETIDAVSVKAFSGDQMEAEFTISPEVPFGEVIRHHGDSESVLVDFGWGDETYRPEDDCLEYGEAVKRVGAFLP